MPTLVSEIPLPDSGNKQLPREPWAVRTSVYRKGFEHPITSVARFDAYAVTRRTGDGLVLTEMWQRRAPEMLAKCCEMLSLRKAFPEELSGLFIDSEFKPEPEDEKPHAEPAAVVAVVTPLVVPQVNQTPATPTNTSRPTETAPQAQATNVPSLPATPVPSTGQIITQEPPPAAPKIEEKKEEKVRKPRAKKEPVNGQDAITAADVEDAVTNPTPDTSARDAELKQQAAAAVEEATSFTEEEAAAQGLPSPPDPIPSKEEMKEITAKIREIAALGISNSDLKEYFLRSGNKTDPKFLTKGNWVKAFEEFHKAKLDGRAKEFVKEVIDQKPKS